MALAFIADLSTSTAVLLIICLLAVCFFEAINGFHDTANAVATVIYTKALTPKVAVIWSGFCNFLGAYLGPAFFVYIFMRMFDSSAASESNIGVAMGVIKLIPLNDLMTQSVGENIALVFAILIASILWNLGTWYLGIPSSSSHTLIGALLGAGFAFWSIHKGDGVNWGKAQDIGLSLLFSPIFGFALAIALMYLLRSIVKKRKQIFDEPHEKKAPPAWIRGVLILTCTLVSFFHGSNDGQKGVGLLLVVLIGFMPTHFALNQNVSMDSFRTAARNVEATLYSATGGEYGEHLKAISSQAGRTAGLIDSLDMKDKTKVFALRKSIQGLNKTIEADLKANLIPKEHVASIKNDVKQLKKAYEFAPGWAILLISICLGIGTMIGWKRIVVTIGEKIGKTHLSYAQGASAEICAAATIALSTGYNLPVSTTHVLSSGIAGTMVASGGIKNLQKKTVKNIAMAWLLTLPVTFLLAALLFLLFRLFV